jgi:hypothetical protein
LPTQTDGAPGELGGGTGGRGAKPKPLPGCGGSFAFFGFFFFFSSRVRLSRDFATVYLPTRDDGDALL